MRPVSTPSRRSSNLLIRFHVAVRLDDLRQRKCLVDERFEVARGKMVEDILLGHGSYFGARDDLKEGNGMVGRLQDRSMTA